MPSILCRLLSLFKAKEEKPKDISCNIQIMGTEFAVNSAAINSSKDDLENFRRGKARKCGRYIRLMRHKKIWAVLSYAKSLYAVYDSDNFYDLDKAILDYENALARFDISDFHPSESDIQCAFRFCEIQSHMGRCEHHLTEAEKQNISNWDTYTLDYTNILIAVSKRFIKYWDEVLGNYKKKDAYLNRVEYIINHLEEVKHRKGVSTIPQIEDYIETLQTHYIELKSTRQNENLYNSKETVKT